MEDIDRSAYRLTPAFDRGLYGGFIGGIGAGCWGSIMYYQLIRSLVMPTISLLVVALEIIIYAVLIGTLLGITTQIFTSFFRHLAAAKKFSSFFFNEVSGGFIGGTITGIVAGALGGWFFGQKYGLPIPLPHQILLGHSLSSLLIIWIATYGYEKNTVFLTNALLSFVLIFFVIGTSVAIIESSNASAIVIDLFAQQTPWRRLIGGIIFGLYTGPIAGLSIGLTMFVFRLREPTVSAHPTNRPEPSGDDHRFGHSNRQISDRGMRNQLRLKRQIDDLQKQWDLLNKKLTGLNEQLILEIRLEEILRLEKLINDTKTQRDQLDEQLKNMENQLAKVDSDA